MSELFIELHTAEIPARLQKKGGEQFLNLMRAALKEATINFDVSRFYVSPRHLALVFTDVSADVPDRNVEKKGPRVDAPATAIQGFLQKNNLTIDQCQPQSTPKGDFLFSHSIIKGGPITALLPAIIKQAIIDMTWPTSMRWSWGTQSWIRPINSGICIFAGQTVAFDVKLNPNRDDPQFSFGNTTVGHRFMDPGPIQVSSFEDYEDQLRQAFVWVDHRKRDMIISHQLYELAFQKNLQLNEDDDLLDEVIGLVEWPVALMGSIDSAFMSLPPIVLKTTMRVHQRYFSLLDDEDQLVPYFITVSNIDAIDKGAQIIRGNERVLNARLADAKFFLDLDLQKSLPMMAKSLTNITFHADLGTMADKSVRLIGLVTYLATVLKMDRITAQEAAALLKADLVSKMVGELPELQGLMGEYYAYAQGYSQEICQAIAEHYLPKSIDGDCPESPLGQICAIADRIDSLVGFFAINIMPTGSKDPYALRRAAIGLIRLLEDDHKFTLRNCFTQAYHFYRPIFEPGHYATSSDPKSQSRALIALFSHKTVLDLPTLLVNLEKFMQDRLKVYWRDQGHRHDIIAACVTSCLDTPLYLLKKRMTALQNFLQGHHESFDQKSRNAAGDQVRQSPSGVDKLSVGQDLVNAYRRASNILRIEEAKDNCVYPADPDRNLMTLDAEIKLVKFIDKHHPLIVRADQQHNIEKLIEILASSHPFVNNYFDQVIVNSDQPEIRCNRLKTLALLRQTFHLVADFSHIVDG